MARTSFFNDNQNRAYPFIEHSIRSIPQNALVDFGSLMGIQAGFIEGQHSVWLHHISRTTQVVRFAFRSDARGLTDHELVFLFPIGSPRFSLQYADCQLIEGDTESYSSCVHDPLWSGYLAIGDLTTIVALLPVGYVVEETDSTVEPALTRNLDQAFVRTVNLANDDRTRATTPAQCRQILDNPYAGRTHVRATCLTGDIRFEAGYHCEIAQDALRNTLTISARDPSVSPVFAGQPCAEIPLYAGETAPPTRSRLDGALRCDEVVRSVNGIGGRVVNITSGHGVSVAFDTDKHQIVVDVNLHDLAVCSRVDEDDATVDEHCSFSASYIAMCGPIA